MRAGVRRRGFTLIELVVVVLVLGILAGIAAPKLFKTTNEATDNGLKQSLATIRDAIGLYINAYSGALPPCTGDGTDFKLAMAEFLRSDIPKSPVGAKNNDVAPATGSTTEGDASPTAGWKFNTETGDFICNSQAMSATGGRYDEF
jgi:general secretion pathway protein G